jgi:hypothetical protein
MIVFSRQLPQQFDQPLPTMMAQLTPSPGQPGEQEGRLNAAEVRQLADAVAAWHIFSPLGICLRRSLLRYCFLHELHVPVSIVFGARLKHASAGGDIGGHAWLTLNGAPYCEQSKDYQGFVPMYVYPVDGRQTRAEL